MRLRLCANIDLKPINIGENMKPETIEALALELTKSKLANKNTTASDWVKTYEASLSEVKVECDKGRTRLKPATAGRLSSSN